MKEKINDSKITRIEIINHAKNNYPTGRIMTLYKELGDFDIAEISMQDGGRTMKIFLNSLVKEENKTYEK
jgi:hypothetical protein